MPVSSRSLLQRSTDARDSGTALLLIDLQQTMDGCARARQRSNPDLEARVAALLACWRRGDGLVVHLHRFSPTCDDGVPSSRLEHPLSCADPLPGERVLARHAESGFVGTGLETWLHRRGVSRLMLAGVATARSVGATACHATSLSFSVTAVEDACADFDLIDRGGHTWQSGMVHDLGMALMVAEGVDEMSVDEVLRGY
ncbi:MULTISPECIES: isochorismatase family protein [Modicisalibacter]|uniref:Isochorismatase family protein n=1 Tax=Modicisalibacter tunisiensis TaxID=390637 RepID=A0ABS7X3K4_9GAMM|nr:MULTISPECIES: isochorismatase family protein [Modicisalibacter]MBZ9537538.1 isochorismatase family protein [Modicisalibacter tunisiensis]MBZ9569039.1 isochorismatase family protein [Modicisalibacter tunisiensis]